MLFFTFYLEASTTSINHLDGPNHFISTNLHYKPVGISIQGAKIQFIRLDLSRFKLTKIRQIVFGSKLLINQAFIPVSFCLVNYAPILNLKVPHSGRCDKIVQLEFLMFLWTRSKVTKSSKKGLNIWHRDGFWTYGAAWSWLSSSAPHQT